MNFIHFELELMEKKEYLVKILGSLESVRDLAPGLKIVVEHGALWDDVLNMLIWVVESGIHSAHSEVAKIKMKKWLDALVKVRQIEKQSSLKDEKELAQLDSLMDDF